MTKGPKRDLYEEAKGHPHGGQHAGRQRTEGQHEQRPQPHHPSERQSDKLDDKPPARRKD